MPKIITKPDIETKCPYCGAIISFEPVPDFNGQILRCRGIYENASYCGQPFYVQLQIIPHAKKIDGYRIIKTE